MVETKQDVVNVLIEYLQQETEDAKKNQLIDCIEYVKKISNPNISEALRSLDDAIDELNDAKSVIESAEADFSKVFNALKAL